MHKHGKVALISISATSLYSNVGIDQLAGFLREHEIPCDIFYFHRGETASQIIESIPADYEYFGFSIYSTTYSLCCKVGQALREKIDGKLFFGGRLASLLYRRILAENPWLDFIVLGDGEFPLLYRITKPEQGEWIPHIATQQDFNHKVPYLNREITWKPAFDFYSTDLPKNNLRKIYCIQTKNNICTGNCSFCFERKGHLVRKPVAQVVAEIACVHRRYGLRKVFFSDDDLLDPGSEEARQYVRELCDLLRQANLKMTYSCYIKAHSFRDTPADRALLSEMVRAGFSSMTIGIEAGNQTDLDLYNKHTTVAENRQIISLLRQCAIYPVFGFIGFNPYSTADTIRQNFTFLQDVKQAGLFHYVASFLGIVFDTAIYHRTKQDDLLVEGLSISNDRAYRFRCAEIRPFMEYLRTDIVPRYRKHFIEIDYLQQYAAECCCLNPQALSLRSQVEELCAEQLSVIRTFLGPVFLNLDLDWFRANEERFWQEINHIQSRALPLYEALQKLYYE